MSRKVAVAAIGAVVALAVGFGVWMIFFQSNTTTYTMTSESMEPTFSAGDKLSVNEDAYSGSSPEPGDVVLFHPPTAETFAGRCGVRHGLREACPTNSGVESSEIIVKRVVAGPGDTLSIRNGHPVVNGVEKSDEPYTLPCGTAPVCDLPKTITVSPGEYFMLGDNRGASDDSRFWGPVPEDWIIGKVE